MDDFLQLACFQMITFVGTARSCYINAMRCAKEGRFDEATELLKQGDEAFAEGHKSHGDMITKEAKGELTVLSLLLIHAEDQLMAAEGFRVIAEEFIDAYKKIEQTDQK